MRLFPNKKTAQVTPSFGWMKRDIHSHLLPGIDDGSPDVATSITLIKQLSAAGIRDFICTPHIFGDMFRNTPDTINAALDQLRPVLSAQCPDVQISVAAEYMIDDYFLELIRKEEKLLTLRGNYLLVELPYSIPPGNMEEITFDVLTSGYQPVLAHPERYGYYHKNMKAYQRLKELGFMFQLNLLSLTGYYGARVRSAARMLLHEGMIDFVGSDLHHEHHLKELLSARAGRVFEKYLGGKVWNEFPGE